MGDGDGYGGGVDPQHIEHARLGAELGVEALSVQLYEHIWLFGLLDDAPGSVSLLPHHPVVVRTVGSSLAILNQDVRQLSVRGEQVGCGQGLKMIF